MIILVLFFSSLFDNQLLFSLRIHHTHDEDNVHKYAPIGVDMVMSYLVDMYNMNTENNICEDVNVMYQGINEEDESEINNYRLRLAEHLRKYLRKEIRMSRFRVKKKIATAKFILKVFKKDLDGPDFLCYLAKELCFKNVEDLKDFLKYANSIAPIGGCKQSRSRELVKKIYEFWKVNAIISIDRRNERNMVKRDPYKIHKLCRDIPDENIKSFVTDKARKKLKGHRHIYNVFLLESGETVSESTFFHIKPFYVQPPSSREMESCTCLNCVNPHYLFSSIKCNIKKLNGKVLPDLLTEYLTTHFTCSINEDVAYHDLTCIQGKCKNECTIKIDTVANDKKVYSYVKYKPTVTSYFNNQGKKVEYTRCARNDEKATL